MGGLLCGSSSHELCIELGGEDMFADQARLDDSAEDVVDDVVREPVPWGQAVKAVPGDGVSLVLDDGKVLILVASCKTSAPPLGM